MVDFMKTGVSIGVGVVDEALEVWDESERRTKSFQTSQDIGRLAGAGLGYLVQVLWPRQGKWGEALALSETPLLIKSISRATVRKIPKKTVDSFIPRREASPARNMGHQVLPVISID